MVKLISAIFHFGENNFTYLELYLQILASGVFFHQNSEHHVSGTSVIAGLVLIANLIRLQITDSEKQHYSSLTLLPEAKGKIPRFLEYIFLNLIIP